MIFPAHLSVPILVGLVTFGSLQTYHLFRANSDLRAMTARAESAEASALSLQQERDALTVALNEQRTRLELVQTERNRANAKLNSLVRSDPAAKSWADVPVPPSLLGVFK